MSNEQTKIGAATILMFMLGAFLAPVVYNIANKADSVPVIATKLEYIGQMVEANTIIQGEMVIALKEMTKANLTEHKEIVDSLTDTKFEVQALQYNSTSNANGIEECKQNLKINWESHDGK